MVSAKSKRLRDAAVREPRAADLGSQLHRGRGFVCREVGAGSKFLHHKLHENMRLNETRFGIDRHRLRTGTGTLQRSTPPAGRK